MLTDLAAVHTVAKPGTRKEKERRGDELGAEMRRTRTKMYAKSMKAAGWKLGTKMQITVRNLHLREDPAARYLFDYNLSSAYRRRDLLYAQQPKSGCCTGGGM